MNETMRINLRKLRLSGLARTLDVRLQEALSNRLSHEEFLDLALADEMEVRKNRLIARRINAAQFRDVRSIEDFDFAFNPGVSKKLIYELATCKFIEQAKDALFLGPPGVGKSHLAQALGRQAVHMGFIVLYRSIFDLSREFAQYETASGENKALTRYLKTDLLIIDDMGMKVLPPRSGEFLLEIIMRRHENRSTIMTSNRPMTDWGLVLGDFPAATAILDRFLQRAEIIEITGRSYRLKNNACKSDQNH